MQVSDVRVKLIDDPDDRLKAVCTVTFDEVFVVRDVKVVEGTNGLFVAMPSRKLSLHCPECKHKNHLRARYCNDCGAELPPYRAPADPTGRSRLHRDLAHPITAIFREELQERVIAAFETEIEQSKDPNYRPPSVDEEEAEAELAPEPARTRSEYDAMIAELRGTPAPAQDQGPRPPVARGQNREERGATGRDRGRRDEGDSRRGNQERPRDVSRGSQPTVAPRSNEPRQPATNSRPGVHSDGRVDRRPARPHESADGRPQPRQEMPRQETPRQETPRQGTPRPEAPRQDTPRPVENREPPQKEVRSAPPKPAPKPQPAPVIAPDDDGPGFGAGIL